MRTRTEHAPMAPVARARPVAVLAVHGPLAGAVLTDRPVTAGSNVAIVPKSSTGLTVAAPGGVTTMAVTRSRGAEERLAAVLLAVAVQAVVLAVVALLLVLLQPRAAETTLTPTPTPQSAPVVP